MILKVVSVPGFYGHLTFVFPCIVSVITIANQQDATILIYLLLISSTCFRRRFRPSSGAYHCNYNFWYCPPMLLLAGVAYWMKLSSTQYATSDYADCLVASRQHNLYDINLLLCVQRYTPDDGQRYCSKHVESYSKN